MKNEEIRNAFLSMLNQHDWDIWVTITSRESISTENARHRLKHTLKFLNTPDKRYFDKYVWLWGFFEKNPYRDGVHIHAVIDGVSHAHCSGLENVLWNKFGQSHVVAMHDGVLDYLADKYVIGNSLDDYGYWKINSRIRQFNNGDNYGTKLQQTIT